MLGQTRKINKNKTALQTRSGHPRTWLNVVPASRPRLAGIAAGEERLSHKRSLGGQAEYFP
jgi:hypothetical protein